METIYKMFLPPQVSRMFNYFSGIYVIYDANKNSCVPIIWRKHQLIICKLDKKNTASIKW